MAGVQLPSEGEGACVNAKNCEQWNTVTANGYCQECWDHGLGGLQPKQGLNSPVKTLRYKRYTRKNGTEYSRGPNT